MSSTSPTSAADVVMGGPLGQAGPQRQDGLGAVRAWICDFSSTQTTTAFSGGLRYSPTTSVSLASSCGSVENLKSSRRQGCSPHLCQTSMMLAVETPSSAASSRDDQWVTPSRFGGGSSVVTTIFTSSTVLGRPDRGRSSSALIPAATYRDRQWRTVGTDVPHRWATAVCGSPSAASSTIRARRVRPASRPARRPSWPASPGPHSAAPAGQLHACPNCLRRKKLPSVTLLRGRNRGATKRVLAERYGISLSSIKRMLKLADRKFSS